MDLFKKGQPWVDEGSEGHILSRSQYLMPGQRLGFVNPADNRKQFLIHKSVGNMTARKPSRASGPSRKEIGTRR
jgi:hypothetical protein